MRARLAVLAALSLTAFVAAPQPAGASCVQESAAEQRARAEVVVEGRILAAAEPGKARLRVSRYLEGDGPRELAIVGGSGPGVVSSIDIHPRAGERWRILGRWRDAGTVHTNVCDGSARVGELGSPAPVDPAAGAPVAPADVAGDAPAWLPGALAVVGIAALVAVWLR